MKSVAFLGTFLVVWCAGLQPTSGQARKIAELEEKTMLVMEDLEVLKGFIQDMNKGLTAAKRDLENLPRVVDASLKKLEPRLKKLEDDQAATKAEVEKLSEDNNGLGKRLKTVEDQLARQRIRVSGQYRLRPEFVTNVENFNSALDEDQNLFASHRVRLGVEAEPISGWSGRFVFQDVRGWGVNDPYALDRSNSLRVHEAYLKAALVPGWAEMKLGRQEWNFGGGRMISKSNWSQGGRSFDGADLTFTWEKYVRADLLLALMDERSASDGKDSWFGGAYITVPYVEGMEFDVYLLYLYDDRDLARRNVGTLGGRVAGKMPFHPALFVDLEATMQFGTVTEGYLLDNTLGDNKHVATAYHVEVGYEIPVPAAKPVVAVFFDSASGDGNTSPTHPDNSAHYGFIPMFPTAHGFLGKMDLFTLTNIWDLGGRVQATPLKDLTLSLEFHSLHLVSDTGALPRGNMANSSVPEPVPTDLGTEIDFWVDYRLNEHFALGGGYSILLPGGALKEQPRPRRLETIADENAPGGTRDVLFEYPYENAAHWFYLQADFTF
jgi:hypothetical protein